MIPDRKLSSKQGTQATGKIRGKNKDYLSSFHAKR
jgi:hypothetical protein